MKKSVLTVSFIVVALIPLLFILEAQLTDPKATSVVNKFYVDLRDTTNGIIEYYIQKGTFPNRLEDLRSIGFDLASSDDPFRHDPSSGRNKGTGRFKYECIPSSTGTICYIYTVRSEFPAKILSATPEAVRPEVRDHPEFMDFSKNVLDKEATLRKLPPHPSFTDKRIFFVREILRKIGGQ